MKNLLLVSLFLSSSIASAGFVEVAALSRFCPTQALVRESGEYYSVRTSGCRLSVGLQGSSSPALRVGGRSTLRMDGMFSCQVIQVLSSTNFPPMHDDDYDCF